MLFLIIHCIFGTKYNKLCKYEIVNSTPKTSTINIISYARLKELLYVGTDLLLACIRDNILILWQDYSLGKNLTILPVYPIL